VRFRLKLITPLLAAGVAVAAIAGAPTAAADLTPAQVEQSCTNLGGTQTQCQSPGNVQIYDAPPQVNYFPLGDS
jgi:hypothetical protein